MCDKRKNDSSEHKEGISYQLLLNTWVETNMECDRALLKLSAGGIALLVTLMTTLPVNCRWLYAVALSLFLVTIILCIIILKRNAKYIEAVLQNPDAEDSRLAIYDRCSLFSFIGAIVISGVIGWTAANNTSSNQEVTRMTKEKNTTNRSTMVYDGETTQESIKNIGKLLPKVPKKPANSSGSGQKSGSESASDSATGENSADTE